MTTNIWLCPRRDELGDTSMFKLPPCDEWWANRTCSHCGSMNPDDLMLRLEAGNVTIGTTDKNYKIYVHNDGGEPVPVKFYFQHFSEEQRTRFIELLNERKIKFSGGLGFYVFPYFLKKI